MSDVIQFYRTSADFGYFSNFAAYPIELDGQLWPTSEHYFQAQKFLDPRASRSHPTGQLADDRGPDGAGP